MAELKLASGKKVKELRVWDGVRWTAKRGMIRHGTQWRGFIRPPFTFADSMVAQSVLVKQYSTALIEGQKMKFDTLITYDVY